MNKQNRFRKSSSFLERTISSIVSLLHDTVQSEQFAGKRGFLQSCDPRGKLVCVAIILCTILVSKTILALGILYAVTLILVLLSSVNLWFFLKRTLLFVPLFSFFIVFPAVFNFVSPGTPLVSFSLFAHDISITQQGITSAILFSLRVLCSVSITVLLVLTTRHHVLLKVLHIFKVPEIFVMTLGMCYRYIFLFLDILQKMLLGIKSRVGFISSLQSGHKIIGYNMGGLWLKSYRLHSQVYGAMVSRGFSGEIRSLTKFRMTFKDYLIVVCTLFSLIGTLWFNRFFL